VNSGAVEDVVAADPAPLHVLFARVLLLTIGKRGSAIAAPPRHLPHSVRALDPFHPQTHSNVDIESLALESGV
jgi:hypothetical protein